MLSFRYPAVGGVYVSSMLDDKTGQSYLPVIELFGLFGIPYEPDIRNFTLKGTYLNPDYPFVINLNMMEIKLGEEKFPVTPDDFRIGATDFYLSPALYEKVFGLSFTVNTDYLNLTLATKHKLPVQEKMEREKKRQRMEGQTSGEMLPLAYGRSRKVLSGAMIDYVINGMYTARSQGVNYSFTGGMEVLGGDIQGTVTGAKTIGYPNTLQAHNLRWRYVIRDNPFIAAITAGQFTTTGLNGRPVRGISVTNEPVEPRRSYDNYVFDGHTVPESEVELYLNDRLIGYMRADELGYYRFNVPMSYGTSRLSTRVYTPEGEVRLIDREMQVPFTFLPTGVVTYTLQAGSIEYTSAEIPGDRYLAHGKLAAGLSRWLTVAAGADYTGREISGGKALLFASLSSRIAKQYLVTADFAPTRYYRLTGNVMYPSDLSVNLVYTRFDGQGDFNPTGATDHLAGSLFVPFRLFRSASGFRLAMDHSVLKEHSNLRYSADFSSRFFQFNLRVNYRQALTIRNRTGMTTDQLLTGSLTYTLARTPGLPVYIRGMFLRGQTTYDLRKSALQSADLQVSRTLFRHGRINLNVGYNFINKTWRTEAGLTIDLRSVRSTTSFNSMGDLIALRESINGSIGVDARGGKIEMSNRDQAGRAAVSVVSYVDNNNSGNYDRGDEVLPYNSVTLENPVTAKVGSDGILRLSQLQSYYRYNLKVNRNGIADPTLVPRDGGFSFVTDPNQYKRMEIAFYRGGVIDGKVLIERPEGLQPQSGLRVLLRGVGNPYETTLRTFADGGFYAMDIPPGNYTLEVDPAQLDFLRVSLPQKNVPLTIRALSEGDYLEGLKIILIPIPEKEPGED